MLTVRDSGLGMSKDTLQRIGEPFFSTKAPGRGTGLGLASGFRSISEVGGSWRVESSAENGTVFFIRLPLVAPKARRAAAVEAPSRSFPEGVVLVVDDEPMVRTALARQLARGGLRAETVESAELALAWLSEARAERVLAVLLDMSMPGLSGAQALPLIRARVPHPPVVALSGHVPNAEQLGDAALILQKPLAAVELLRALHTVIA